MSDEISKDALERLQEATIVEIQPGVAAVFSEKPVPGLETLSFDLMPEGSDKIIADSLSGLLGGANLLAQYQDTSKLFNGLVRLTPTTMEKLQTMSPVVAKTGENLGVLKSAGGNGFSHVMQWSELAPADLAKLKALSAGPTLPLVALQMQLASISRRLDENIELTRQAINEIRQVTQEDRWATLIALDASVSKAVEEARHVGKVSKSIFAPIHSKEDDIRKSRDLFKQSVAKHLTGLQSAENKSERKAYITEHQNGILNDAYGFLLAEWTRHRWNVLRAANISLSSDEDETKLLETVLETTQVEYEDAQRELQELVGNLVQQLKLMSITDAQAGLKLPLALGRRRNAENPLEKAEQLARSIAELAGGAYREPDAVEPALLAFKDEEADNLLPILQWSLPQGQQLLVLADINIGMRNSYLGITQDSFFITRYSDLKKNGDTGPLYKLEDVRYVRLEEVEKLGPVIHLYTASSSFVIGFDGWVNDDEGNLEKARRIADIFATVMNLPESEKKQDPIFELVASKQKAITE